MCGILFSIQDRNVEPTENFAPTWSTLQELNSRRGPSAQDSHNVALSQPSNDSLDSTWSSNIDITFYGAVLHLRGDKVTRQPHVSSTGNVLLWNGEIFDGIAVDHHENDGRVLMDQLEAISTKCHDGPKDHKQEFLNLMAKIEGPYAFVYFHAHSESVYFGRDCLGRRSLLWHKSDQVESTIGLPFILTSTGYSDFRSELLRLEEVPADGIYSLPLASNSPKVIAKHPWVPAQSSSADEPGTMVRLIHSLAVIMDSELSAPFADGLKFDQAHPDVVPPITEDMMEAITGMIEILGDSVRRRVQDIPRTGLVHDARVGILFSGGLDCLCLAALADRFLPEGEAIDLLNVGFENPRSVKAKAAEEALAQKRLKKKQDASESSGSTNGEKANNENAEPAKPDTRFNVPDRTTGYESLAELRKISPRRHWNFVEVNVPFEEAMAQRSEILERIAPLETVMDLSIAMAFWFASRGVGYIKNEQGELDAYTSQAKVLLSGLGADEQLGGYSRHKDQFTAAGWEGLIHELQLDLDRISTRNLGRDDRIISDHGKEARYPFLSTNVVQFLSKLRVDLKVDLRYPRGVGEKILLRHVARELGFDRASSHWKRAVQFGARTAKMTDSGRAEIGQQVVDRAAE
ncbi:MAG: asparagine synthase-domain-containing protein [Linnemannia elongata]|nr:MAG: asparagine synthase-domain-containing protein [Linnemannia elongata]